jgi:hypothetical protein
VRSAAERIVSHRLAEAVSWRTNRQRTRGRFYKPAAVASPKLSKATLDDGTKVVVDRRHGKPRDYFVSAIQHSKQEEET